VAIGDNIWGFRWESGRRFLGVDLDKRYAKAAAKRIQHVEKNLKQGKLDLKKAA
jgi:DNA modification methylase